MVQLWHRQSMRVHYKDTDQMGVAHHANYVTWFEIGRTEWMRHAGIAYSKMEERGLLLPVIDLQTTYKKPAEYDDEIDIFTCITEISQARLRFYYEARRTNTGETEHTESDVRPYGELLTSGHTLHMWLNSDWKPVRIKRAAPEVYQQLKKYKTLLETAKS